MNATLCPLCNHLLARRYEAFIRSEWREVERLENELSDHQVTCGVLKDMLVSGLWQGLRVVVVEEVL
jgi:hypothetical protein